MEPFTFFISYRRKDTAPIALLLKHELEARLEFVRVFVDVESVEVGEEFPARIKHSIEAAGATIVLIGDQWMPLRGSPPEPGAGSNPDYVALEVKASMTLPVLGPDERVSDSKRAIVPIFINLKKGEFDRFEIPEEIQAIKTVNAERLDTDSWPDAIGPLVKKLADRLHLKERVQLVDRPKPDRRKAETQPIGDEELLRILHYDAFDGWYVDNFGKSDRRYLVKTFSFSDDFGQAAEFMRIVSAHCTIMNHHPDWRNVYDKLSVSLATWDAGDQVTIYDLDLALFMNKVEKMVAARARAPHA